MANFGTYSKYYDLLYKDKDYNKEADYIADKLKNAKSILELGCGTGIHSSILSNKGYDMYGIDLSETMLESAKNRGNKCELGDVRTFRCNKKFDAVISLFHILSYQNTDEDVNNFFKTANYHLNSKGKLLFDVWHKPAVLYYKPEKRTKVMQNDEIKVIRYCTPVHKEEKSIVEVNYKIEIYFKEGTMETINECHPMRYFSIEEIKDFADKNGFNVINQEEWLSKNPPNETTWSVCYEVEKR